MKYITISQEGYKEFEGFLHSINFKSNKLRIRYLGKKCSGPIFNIDIGIEGRGDIVEEVNNIKFIMKKELIDEYGGFLILANSENNGQGLILKPVIEQVNGCSICPGC